MFDAIVLLSGGQDSTTCLFWAKKRFDKIVALSFDFGQKNIKELDCAKKLCELIGIEHTIMDLKLMESLKSTENFISGRNLFFLSFAALIAKKQNIKDIVIGVSQQDNSGFSDCRDIFIKSVNVALNLGMDYSFNIHTPLINLNKKEIWKLAENLGIIDIIKTNTVTCYNGILGLGCGTCASCILRNNGYKDYEREKEAINNL